MKHFIQFFILRAIINPKKSVGVSSFENNKNVMI